MPGGARVRHRRWVFTLNNPDDGERQRLRDALLPQSKYLCIGSEVGDSGTPHLQGYVIFKSQRTLSACKAVFYPSKPHLEASKGTPAQASDYCKKDGDFIEAGDLPAPGKRNDIADVRSSLESGGNMRVTVDVARSCQSVRFAEKWLTYREKRRSLPDGALHVEWHYGPTGCGKSRHVFTADYASEAYVSATDGKWFDGYDGHDAIIFDDFRGSFCKFSDLLRILDRNAYRLPFKGGFRQLLASKFYFTSSKAPWECYDTTEDNVSQLLRRITHLYRWEADGTKTDVRDVYYDDATRQFIPPARVDFFEG